MAFSDSKESGRGRYDVIVCRSYKPEQLPLLATRPFHKVAMPRRDLLLARAIAGAICRESDPKPPRLLARILNYFRLLTIVLYRYCPDLFDHLRLEIWGIGHADYRQSFSPPDGYALRAVGDLGYSGSVSADPKMQLQR